MLNPVPNIFGHPVEFTTFNRIAETSVTTTFSGHVTERIIEELISAVHDPTIELVSLAAPQEFISLLAGSLNVAEVTPR